MDAFFSRETSTVTGNLRRLRRYYFDSVEALSIRRPVPIIGTDEVRYIVGMGRVLQTLEALQRKGNWQYQLQWDLVRRTPTWYTNAWEAASGSLEAGAIYSENDIKLYESTATTASIWFSIFVLVKKQRMGVVRR